MSTHGSVACLGQQGQQGIGKALTLQEDLGELNDIFVHAGGARLDKKLHRRAERAMAAAERHWARLRKLGPWWV